MHSTNETIVRPLEVTRDPLAGPVPAAALRADAATRASGRVQMLNASQPGGLDGWTLDLPRYELLTEILFDAIDEQADDDGAVALPVVVERATARLAGHPLFPGGRLRNYVRFTAIDLQARCEIERVGTERPERFRRWTGPAPAELED